MTTDVDLCIIGGGAAGLTAGLFAARARLNTVLIDRMGPGGQIINVDRIENYPGFPDGIAGFELGPLFGQQAMDAGLQIEYAEANAVVAGTGGQRHVVHTDTGAFAARAVILACGSTLARLGIPGEDAFEGRGVSYCATCDGEFFRDQPVAVVGGGDSALDEARYLAGVAAHVTVIHRRDTFRGERLAQERLHALPNCTVLWNTTPVAIHGDDGVTGIDVRSLGGEPRRLDVAGVFVYVGLQPNTAFLEGIVDLDGGGHVIADTRMRTSVPGIFAAGDLRQYSARQIAACVGDGATAALWAERHIRGKLAR